MTDTINKILQIGLWLVLGVSVVLFIVFYASGESMTDTVITWGQILLAITLVLLLIFPIAHFIKNPKSALQFLFVLLGFAALFFVSYFLADNSTDGAIFQQENITPFLSQLIGAGIIMIYILSGIAVLSMVVTAIINALK
jgi:hypothetical protein